MVVLKDHFHTAPASVTEIISFEVPNQWKAQVSRGRIIRENIGGDEEK